MTAVAPAVGIFTIGHSSHPLGRFVELLTLHGIDAVADVRSMPYSRWRPQYNREALRDSLKSSGISYVFLGRELGARTQDPACQENGVVQYRKLANTGLFRSGIERVLDGSQRMKLALMCAEKDPLDCHRGILLARELVERGKEIEHIHADGGIEAHPAAMERLRGQLNIPADDLFPVPLAAIYAAQEKRIAHVGKERASEAREPGQ